MSTPIRFSMFGATPPFHTSDFSQDDRTMFEALSMAILANCEK
jgi:hypothetical protein